MVEPSICGLHLRYGFLSDRDGADPQTGGLQPRPQVEVALLHMGSDNLRHDNNLYYGVLFLAVELLRMAQKRKTQLFLCRNPDLLHDPGEFLDIRDRSCHVHGLPL